MLVPALLLKRLHFREYSYHFRTVEEYTPFNLLSESYLDKSTPVLNCTIDTCSLLEVPRTFLGLTLQMILSLVSDSKSFHQCENLLRQPLLSENTS
jgi:hypothetical protein